MYLRILTRPSHGWHTIFVGNTHGFATKKKNQAEQTTSITQWRLDNSSMMRPVRLTEAKGIPQIQGGELINEWVLVIMRWSTLPSHYDTNLVTFNQSQCYLYTLLLEQQGMKRLPTKDQVQELDRPDSCL